MFYSPRDQGAMWTKAANSWKSGKRVYGFSNIQNSWLGHTPGRTSNNWHLKEIPHQRRTDGRTTDDGRTRFYGLRWHNQTELKVCRLCSRFSIFLHLRPIFVIPFLPLFHLILSSFDLNPSIAYILQYRVLTITSSPIFLKFLQAALLWWKYDIDRFHVVVIVYPIERQIA